MMRTGRHLAFRPLAAGFALLMSALAAHAQAPSVDELLSAVVRIKTFINPDGRTVQNLGHEREGSGIVIDSDGLVLTIGYLMVEAHGAEVRTNDGRAVPANVVGYDHDTGFGLLRTIEPLKLKPMPIGKSGALKERDPVLVVSFGGAAMAGAAEVVSKREFTGSWEYLLDDAIFTAPLHPLWSGAALVSRDGRLVGVGSLVVGDARGTGGSNPGNMFVPIDGLQPILADLIADGKPSRVPRPWLGLTTNEEDGRLVVARAVPGGPAEKAGVERGAVIVTVNGEKPKNLGDFYRKVWAAGRAGATVPIEVTQGGETRRIDIQSMNRLDHLKLKSTF
jgi:S1-C subfamily serine protease